MGQTGEIIKCYKCAESGVDEEAVAICVVCGMGLCMDHAKMVEVSFWEKHLFEGGFVSGLGVDNRVEVKVPKFLCDVCYARFASKAQQAVP